jgi:hypothetical protein
MSVAAERKWAFELDAVLAQIVYDYRNVFTAGLHPHLYIAWTGMRYGISGFPSFFYEVASLSRISLFLTFVHTTVLTNKNAPMSGKPDHPAL